MYYYFWGSLRTLKQLRVGEGGSKVGSRSARMVYEYLESRFIRPGDP